MSAAPSFAARQRHPCMRAPVRETVLRHRVVAELECEGARHPEVAAAVLAVRGASGEDQAGFARRTGIDIELLRRAESGEIGRDDLPGALRRMVPRP